MTVLELKNILKTISNDKEVFVYSEITTEIYGIENISDIEDEDYVTIYLSETN